MSKVQALNKALRERILILDGASGTMIQGLGLEEDDFRGSLFRDHERPLKGCNDLLNLTLPDAIVDMHLGFLRAGADILETNTFSATRIALADYGLEDQVLEINREGARAARRAVEIFAAEDPGRARYVAGSIGPTNATASLSPDVENPSFRAVSFDTLVETYYEAAVGLIEGGVDILLPETSYDTLNLKAALFAIEKAFGDGHRRVPVIASITITDRSGRTLSGQTPEAALHSISHAELLALGINCALGADDMRAHVEELSAAAPTHIACYPNAGLPNEFGEYDDSPEIMARILGEFADEGWLNLVGGCCGTTPDHIRAIAAAMEGKAPRQKVERKKHLCLSGLEPLEVLPESNFMMIGERTNVMGSRKFRRLIMEDKFEEAVEVARQQVAGGANLLDICMDDGMLDGEASMTRFVNLLGTEPDIARIPFVIDSSKWSILEAGLKCLQGKGVVNSISLKEGEEEFRKQAELIRRYGAAVVVMAFDEEGQADTAKRRIEICSRAFRILTEEVGFPSEDIIFDPNVLTVATGIEAHDGYAVSFIEATREIKDRMPGVYVSGGISNVSFSFRGNDRVREAMHSSFLYHAIRAGLDMGIVNAGQLEVYEEVEPALMLAVEDVLLNRTTGATEALTELAQNLAHRGPVEEEVEAWREESLEDRIAHGLLKGIDAFVTEDIAEALEAYPRPLDIIEGPLMRGMTIVGELFGAGKMFLPQVVKSARVMKKAVAILEPLMEKDGAASNKGTILMATVKGDVHDIGKNIVGVVLRCNGYRVLDLGVMVPAETILDQAIESGANLIGLSGLITPSLDQMIHVAKEMKRREITVPLLIGGATTSKKHTAVRIAPAASTPVIHVADASLAAATAGQLLSRELCEPFLKKNREEQGRILERFAAQQESRPLHDLAEARKTPTRIEHSEQTAKKPPFVGTRCLAPTLGELVPLIDWSPFFHAWELRGRYPQILEDERYGTKAREVWDDGQALLRRFIDEDSLKCSGVYGFFPAARDGDDVVVYDDAREHERLRFFFLRQQEQRKEHLCLADFVGEQDYLGAFCVTSGIGLDAVVDEYEADHDDYHAIMAKAIADRLAEAFAEYLHQRVRMEWGWQESALSSAELAAEDYTGIRPAFGYPACPDHSEKETLFSLLDAEAQTGVSLTSGFAMLPTASVSGVYFGHPQSKYFSVGRIARDQVEAYARRKGISIGRAEMLLAPNLAY